jgi:hypothetical protein
LAKKVLKGLKIKKIINAEKNLVYFSLVKEVLKNNLYSINSFIAWKKYISRYINPEIIHRKKDINDFELRFNGDFFEILYSIHLIVYIFGKRLVSNIDPPFDLKNDLFNTVFEDTLNNLRTDSLIILTDIIQKELNQLIRAISDNDIYELFESIYRSISPKEIRKPLGEYFTPVSLAEKMINDIPETKVHSQSQWLDNSSGFGVFLNVFLKKYGIKNLDNFTCIEINPLSVFISKVVLVYQNINDLNIIKKIPIYWGDSLLNERYSFQNGAIIKAGDFSHLFGKIDLIIGNPPWVNWKSMTKEYQALIGEDWRSYGIFETLITRRTLGACNDDISSYFVYYSIDKFLVNLGFLKFVINLSLFKSDLVGKQFRKFNIAKSNSFFKLEKLYDLSNYKIFQGVTNSYCIFDAIKGEKTTYPIPYLVFSENQSKKLTIFESTARPVKNKEGEALVTIDENDKFFNDIEGVCEYKARAGVCTWLNSVYWVKIKKENKKIKIINMSHSGKKKVLSVETEVENALLYRLLRARNLSDFKPIIENAILVPHIKNDFSKPISEIELMNQYPLTYSYFLNFKNELINRSGYQKFLQKVPFYSLYNIGPYTLAPIKLGWQFVSKKFQVYLINDAEDIVPDLNVMFIPLYDIDEAYYLHALLNSPYARRKIEASSNWTFPSGSINKIHLIKYNKENPLHIRIANLQKKLLQEEYNLGNDEMDLNFKEYWFKNKYIEN